MDNPNYEVVEMTRNSPYSANSATSPAPVYTPNVQHNNDNRVPTLERTLDDDNPLYSSTALEDSDNQYVPMTQSTQQYHATQIEEDHDYALPPEDLSYPPPPSQPPPPIPMTHSTQPHSYTQIEEDHDYALPPEDLSYSPPPSQPPPVPPPYAVQVTSANAATGAGSPAFNLHDEGNNPVSSLNPYGEYGEGTLKRVASQLSVNQGGETEPQTVIAVGELFDNPDYMNAVDIDVAYTSQ